MYLLDVAVFLMIFGLPLVPGLREILKPHDSTSLSLNTGYTRNPHFFGDSMRAKVAPLLEQRGTKMPYNVSFLGRHGEQAHVDETIVVPANSKNDDVLVAFGRIEVKQGASLLDAYGVGSLDASDRISARTLLSDGDIHLGDGCKIGRWIDAAGTLSVGASCDLGSSATAGGRVMLGNSTHFTRLFGMPILAAGSVPANRSEAPPVPGDIIRHGDLQIEKGRSVGGTVKTYGSLTIGAGVHIAGNAIARGDVTIEQGARVDGHVFSEGWLSIGPAVRIGLPDSSRTAYGALGIHLAPSAEIFGWLVSNGQGSTVQ